MAIRFRRGTAAQWASANPTLASGEPGYETDTGVFKIGDGTHNWATLTPAEVDEATLSALILDVGRPAAAVSPLTGHWYPQSFGAVGDGTTDDTTAWQNMLNALPDGAVVDCGHASRYKITTGLTATNKKGLRFIGGGRHTAEPNTPGTSVPGGAVLVAGAAGITVLTLDCTLGTSMHSGPEFRGVHFEDSGVGQIRYILTAATTTSNTATFTTSAAHALTTGDTIYVYNVTPSAYNGVWTVASTPSSTTFTVALGSTPANGTAFGRVAKDALSVAPTSALLTISGYTRWLVDSCSFYGGTVGIKFDPGVAADVSWGRVRHCSFKLNNRGVYVHGTSGAKSLTIDGGDFSVATGQVGVDVDDPTTMFSIVGRPKFDVGQNTNTSGTGAVGVRIKQAANFNVEATFEMNGGTGIDVGAEGLAFGRIASAFQANQQPRTPVGIKLNGTDATTNAVQNVHIVGSTFNGLQRAIYLGNAHHCNVIGGGVHIGDEGIYLDTASARNNVRGFMHSSTNTPYTHITDLGTSNQSTGQGNNDANTADVPVGPSVKSAKTATTTVSNTTTETALASYTVPGNSTAVGTTYRVRAWGQTDNIATSGTLIVRLRVNGITGSVLYAFTWTSQTSATTLKGWFFDGEVTFRAGGSAALVSGGGIMSARWAATGQIVAADSATPAGTLDFSTAKDIVLTAQFATADPGNVIRCDGATFELVKP